ncbi:MAG: ATP-dependent helicase HrpB, partial [uncultured bacterium]
LTFPLHPRLARIMLEAKNRNCEEAVAVFVTHLLLKTHRGYLFDAKPMRHNPIWGRQFEQLKPVGAILRDAPPRDVLHPFQDLEGSFLAGFPDFVGQIKKSTHKDEQEVLMCQGGRALLKSDHPLPEKSLVLILDVMESRQGTYQKIHVDAYIPIEKDLIMKQSSLLKDEVILKWNDKLSRVDEVYQVHYGALLLEEETNKASPGPLAAEALMNQGLGMSFPENVSWPDLAAQISLLARKLHWEAGPSLLARLYWLSQSGLADTENILAEKMAQTLKTLCLEVVSLNELKEKVGSFIFYFDTGLAQLLQNETPEFVSLPGRSKTPIQYSLDKSPFIESRMQDFFGLNETPKILQGRVPLTCHLLAPNYRAVQVTQDLRGFWQKVYPEIKTQLQRRYPRHKWI